MARPRQVQPATLQGLAGLNEIEDDAGRGSPGGRVYALLRRAIVNIDLAPGTALNEVAVAESLGVSRIPVREAFRKLMTEGLVEIQPQKGTFISRLRRSQLQDALFVREALECAAVEKAAVAPEDWSSTNTAARSGRVSTCEPYYESSPVAWQSP